MINLFKNLFLKKRDPVKAISFLPTTAVLEMTYRCNHVCNFCSCPWERENPKIKKQEELSTDQWKDVISKMSQMGIKNICFTGGEALLRKDIWEIIDFTSNLNDFKIISRFNKPKKKRKKMKMYLISNAKILDSEKLDLIKKYDIQLSVSLPGLDSFSYHTQESGPDKVLHTLKSAKEKGLNVVVNITITKKNLHELYETICAAFDYGAVQLLLNVFLKGGRGLSYQEELALTKSEIIFALSEAERALIKYNKKGSIGTEIPKCLFDKTKLKKLKVSHKCSAGKNFFVIGPSGYIRVCNHSEINLDHYTEIEKLKENSYWKKFVQKEYLPKKCYHCKEADDCVGGCREEAHILFGEINSENEYVENIIK